MRRLLLLIVPCILAACGSASPGPVADPTAVNGQMVTQVPGLSATKLFQLTAEVETRTAGTPKNDATITAIMASKYAVGTAMAETMTAMPTETPIPTIPPDSPFCHPADLRTSFGSNAATQQILLGAGLTNISATPCYLLTWPQVVLIDRQRKPLDVDYSYFDPGVDTAVAAATEQAGESATAKVGLWPGWSTWINLAWGNWCGTSVSDGVVIHLTLGDNDGIINIPTNITGGGACNAPGYRSEVGISKLGPGTPPH